MRAAMTRIRFKGAAVAAASVAMAVMLTACGGDDGSDEPESKPQGASSSSAGQESEAPAPPEDDEGQVLASIKGKDGVEAIVSSVKREAGGFVTVKGTVKNGSKQIWTAPGWQGMEQEVAGNGASMAGTSLVDQTGKKRYLVLRDTDGRCLCTKFEGLTPGAEAPFFAQFPAPPQSTTEVDFQIPTMPTATIKISG
ncbi:hypothetical protein OG337_22235 [[Kitasatospora] papulosa]|uniref:hypothetical protein n=1 Tax=Streptomyces TaxID=1883 RepID=UPI0004BE2949|nr:MULTISPECIES: hypothetical protein [Streptomyces]MCY1653389.1 hypothetical protein [Streptomyces sp. SL203]MCY1679366.1 hypothetical protein [Streptomyces sp. SL294]WSZ49903.1 hypothetical protein OG337_22235 [[Kitasatospora] papulosa]